MIRLVDPREAIMGTGAETREDAMLLGKKAHAVVLLLAALGLVAAGLYGATLLRETTTAAPPPDASAAPGVVLRNSVLTTIGPPRSAAGPRLTGRLAMVGGCLGLDRGLVVWPPGTTWNASKKRLTVPGSTALPLGARLRVAGRALTPAQLTRTYGPNAVKHVRSCRAGTAVTVLDPGTKVRRLDHRQYVL